MRSEAKVFDNVFGKGREPPPNMHWAINVVLGVDKQCSQENKLCTVLARLFIVPGCKKETETSKRLACPRGLSSETDLV